MTNVNFLFGIFIIFLSIIEITFILKKSDNSIRATIMAVGIFGTFVGIYLGLQAFNSSDVKGSILEIIHGLSTAFLTSIFGMGASIALTLFSKIIPLNDKAKDEKLKEQFYFLEKIYTKIDNYFDQNSNNTQDFDYFFKTISTQLTEISQNNRDFYNKNLTKLEDLNSTLKATSFEELKNELKDISLNLSKTIEDNSNKVTHSIETNTKNLMQNFEDNTQETTKTIETSTVTLINNFKSNTDEVSNSIEVNTKNLMQNFEDNTQETTKTIETSTVNLSKTIEDNSNKVSNSIETNITSVKDNFNTNSDLITQAVEENNRNIINLAKVFKNNTDDVIAQLDTSLNTISKHATNEVAKAFKFITDDFNNSLMQNFGKNFSELNTASENLLDWQNNYKKTIEDSENRLQKAIDTIEGLEKIASAHNEIIDIFKKLETILNSFSIQSSSLEQHLQSYKQLGNDAQKFMPDLQNYLNLFSQNVTQNR